MAAGMLSLALMAFSATSLTLTQGTRTADSLSAATALAQVQLEEVRAQPLGSPDHTPGSYADTNNPMNADGSPGGKYSRTWVVSGRDVPVPGLKTVVVSVAWNDPLPHTTRLSAYVRCDEVPCP